MARRAWLLGILLVGAAFQWNVDVGAKDLGRAGTSADFDIYDYPYPGDGNWSYNLGDPCRNVSYGPMGGTNDWQWKSDSELEQAVECQLSKRPFLRSEEIKFTVKDGTATLRGTVKDHDSVRSLVVDVYGAGVKDVVSQLVVEGDTQ